MKYVEIDARNPFKQTKFQELEKYVKPNYYMSFTKLKKIGINPNNVFGTPTGIYTYPVREMYQAFLNHKLPYAQDARYIQVLQLKTNKILDNTATKADFDRVIKELEKLFPKYIKLPMSGKNQGRLMLDIINAPQQEKDYILNTDFSFRHFLYWINVKAKKFDSSYFAKIWAATYIFSMLVKPTYMHFWNKLLQHLGYLVVNDIGAGIIHPNEPVQAVFLSVKAFNHVDTIINTHNDNYININNKMYSINNLPTNLDRLVLDHNRYIKRLPDNLTANYINLNDTNIKFLPNNLTVEKLNIGNTPISELPPDIKVKTLYAEGSDLRYIPKSVYIDFLDVSQIPYRVEIQSEKMGQILAESSNLIIPNCKIDGNLIARHSRYVKLGNVSAKIVDLQKVQTLYIEHLKCDQVVLPNDFKYYKGQIDCPQIDGGIFMDFHYTDLKKELNLYK